MINDVADTVVALSRCVCACVRVCSVKKKNRTGISHQQIAAQLSASVLGGVDVDIQVGCCRDVGVSAGPENPVSSGATD